MTENKHFQNDEIDLKELLVSIASRKKFIIGFTAIVTILVILYALSITPTYKVSISFLSPSQSSVIELNKIKIDSVSSDGFAVDSSVTSGDIYQKFLNKFMSREFQRKIFDENDYLAKLNPENKPINNADIFFYEFSKSLILKTFKTQQNIEKINFEKPIEITIKGSNAQVIANYLNDLASSANKETIDDFLSIIEQKIAIRLKEISDQINLLEQKHNKEKLNKINDLLYHLSIAKELKIKKNNLNIRPYMSDSSVIVDSSQRLPKWYLLGEKVLEKEIELLKANKFLFIPAISKLEIERIRLESIIVSNTNINSMQLNQKAFPPKSPIKPNKRFIVSVAAVAGFILSILLVLLMNAFRTENNKVTE